MRAAPGARSFAPLERTQQLLVERIVEIVGHYETSLVDTEHGPVLVDRHVTDHGPPGTGDDDILSRGGPAQQPERWVFASWTLT